MRLLNSALSVLCYQTTKTRHLLHLPFFLQFLVNQTLTNGRQHFKSSAATTPAISTSLREDNPRCWPSECRQRLAGGKTGNLLVFVKFSPCGAITMPRLRAPTKTQTWVSVAAPPSFRDRCLGSAAYERHEVSRDEPGRARRPPTAPGSRGPWPQKRPGGGRSAAERLAGFSFSFQTKAGTGAHTQLANTKKGRKLQGAQPAARGAPMCAGAPPGPRGGRRPH